MNLDTNVNSEMSDLVCSAEQWARAGFTKVPQLSEKELITQKIGKGILTRAAFLLMKQMGVKSVDEYRKMFGGTERREEEDDAMLSAVSPMPVEEFQKILHNGWPLTHSPIAAFKMPQSPAKQLPEPRAPTRKSEPPAIRRLVTDTPSRRFSTPVQKLRRNSVTASNNNLSRIQTEGETPLENRASRLRRLKLEEKMQNTSMNSTFGMK